MEKEKKNGFPHKLTREEQVKGGKAKSERKTKANRIKAIKHGKYAKYVSEDFVNMLKDPNQFMQLLGRELKVIMDMDCDATTKLKRYDALLKTSTAIFGQKNFNVNANINFAEEAKEIVERVSKMKDVEKLFESDDSKKSEKYMEIIEK
jgi:hypothetical protein